MIPVPWFAGVVLALLTSLGLNAWQAKRAVEEAVAAPLRAQVAALEADATLTAVVAVARREDDLELERLRAELAAAEGQVRVVYRDRVRELPAPACAPGQGRVDAWNLAGVSP